MTKNKTPSLILTWGWTLSLFLLISYLICIAFGLIAPRSMHMHEAWGPLLPGFKWLNWPGFIAGAIDSFAYGWYIAIIGVPLKQWVDRKFGVAPHG